MCLGTKLTEIGLNRYKSKGKKLGYIWVWKTAKARNGKYVPEYYPEFGSYEKWLNKARPDARFEDHLIHAFRKGESAKRWGSWKSKILKCLVSPDWIKAIGREGGYFTLTTKAIVMPEYPKTKVTIREFRAAIKGKKIPKYDWE